MFNRYIFGLLLLLVFRPSFTMAQSTTTLAVNGNTGTINTGDACPAPRQSAAYADIQAAVNCALDGDIITLAAGTYAENVTIGKTIRLQGSDTATTIVDGSATDSVFTIQVGAAVTLENLTITDGNAQFGGGIFTRAGTVTIINSIITANTATTSGGGVFTAAGTLTITDTTISNNTGGGIAADGGTVIVNNSTVSGNTDGGIETTGGTTTLTSATISGNDTGLNSGAATIHLRGSTLAANTVSGLEGTQARINTRNSLLADNTNADCRGTLTSQGYNLIETLPAECVLTGDTATNITGQDPLLVPLGGNGGPTLTHALLHGSPALDAGNPALPGDFVANPIGCEATDQRGVARIANGCDIGAWEGLRADCNADARVDAGDLSALTLEVFDGDGNNPLNVSGGTFVGDSVGCNANKDALIDAGDLSCVVLIAFEGQEACSVFGP